MTDTARLKGWTRIFAKLAWPTGRGICFGLMLLSIVAAPAAFAQSSPQSPGQPVQPELKEPPYEQQLIRLSEILGALHYLRPLCGHDEADEWRQRMYSLLGAEVQNELRRRRLVERFNQSYRGFASVYQTCTPAAVEASRRFADEGVIITQEVTGKYSRD
ncbi:TIGR02301 family protein [Pseudovibrio ascidiaceicola]|uniref:TIGR02301 family protein n=1 Tax=Pseudovibrio ascidiaceicola TaxID=285279 RepID=UPI001AD8F5EE|nr:TIGR02301 family protein [Pseudovibrio ascidiaceicola]